VVGKNRSGELIFIVPALPAGDYTLEVWTTIRGSEDVCIGTLEATLTAS
jgi:hypothetical protein